MAYKVVFNIHWGRQQVLYPPDPFATHIPGDGWAVGILDLLVSEVSKYLCKTHRGQFLTVFMLWETELQNIFTLGCFSFVHFLSVFILFCFVFNFYLYTNIIFKYLNPWNSVKWSHYTGAVSFYGQLGNFPVLETSASREKKPDTENIDPIIYSYLILY